MHEMSLAVVISLLTGSVSSYLLGAGEGMGSCAAYPFRSLEVYWSKGCPPHAPCCSEFGYCRPRVSCDILELDCMN